MRQAWCDIDRTRKQPDAPKVVGGPCGYRAALPQVVGPWRATADEARGDLFDALGFLDGADPAARATFILHGGVWA